MNSNQNSVQDDNQSITTKVPLEEFWKTKLESIESKYDLNVNKMQRSILSEQAHRRELMIKDDKLANLKKKLQEKTEDVEQLSQEKSNLTQKLVLNDYKTRKLGERLLGEEEIKQKVIKSYENERFERMKREKELVSLKHRLKQLERDKRFLIQDLSIKTGEQKQIEDQAAALAQNKFNLIKSLTDIDQERRIQAELNTQLVDEVGRLLNGNKSQEYTLLKQRKEIDLMLDKMKQKRMEQEETLRKLEIHKSKIFDARDEKRVDNETLERLERQVRHWKEEFAIKESENGNVGLEIKDLHRENSQLRCQLAEMREKLKGFETQMKFLETEKRRTEIELEKAKGQAKSVHMQMARNEIVKQRLANKILKSHPHIQQSLNLQEKKEGTRQPVEKKTMEIQSYKRKIWDLERQKRELEEKLNELRGKHNRLQFKVKKYDGMETQILWTEKAMVKLEGDRNRLEDLLKTMSLTVPKKLPFEKLVTDPSILDRMSTYQVLQKRLSQQSEKVENLKRNAIKILDYRRLKAQDEITDKRRELPQWKLSHWKKYSSEDTLADVDQQVLLDPELQSVANNAQTSLVDRKYYRDYVGFLDKEIPELRKKIGVIERKQQVRQQQLLDEETKARRYEDVGRGSLDDDKVLGVPLIGEEQNEDEEDALLDDEDDSDMGMLGVISMDEPSSRPPSVVPPKTEDTENVDGAKLNSDNQFGVRENSN